MRASFVSVLGLLVACATAPVDAAHEEPGATVSEGEDRPADKRGRRGIPAIVRCDRADECVVLPRTCCGRCGAPTGDDARAVNAAELRAQSARGEPICEGSASCPDCYEEPSATLFATCAAHRCTLVDLERHPMTACRVDADCETTFAGCCECGSPGAVAVTRGRVDAYRRLRCGSGPVACPACVGQPVPAGASCVAGHCVAPASSRGDDE